MFGPVVLPPPTRCLGCGYDLCGLTSVCCPECGGPRMWKRLAFVDDDEFQMARAVLERERIPVRIEASSSGLPASLGFSPQRICGELLIGEVESARAERALEEAGIHIPVPIVDRSEPACPGCATALDRDGPAICPGCGMRFQWVDIASSTFEGDHCLNCGYPYEGSTSERCPECGDYRPAEPVAQWDVMEPAKRPRSLHAQHRLTVLVTSLGILAMLSLMRGENRVATLLGAIAALALALASLIAIRLRP